jgi:tryptophan 2,3-dioxygenase
MRTVRADRPRYADLLRLPELLSLQPPDSGADELLFVVIHQSHELWFKLIVRELENLRDHLFAGELAQARHRTDRLIAVTHLLTEHWSVLDTLRPADFLAFRDRLTGGSGFESVQYREIEFLSGLKSAGYLEAAELPERDRVRLQQLIDSPSVHDAFLYAADTCGYGSISDLYDPLVSAAAAPLLDVAEQLVDFDTAFARWRFAHSVSVERQIGCRIGTGGSSGTSYLRSRTELRMFPTLWQARSHI